MTEQKNADHTDGFELNLEELEQVTGGAIALPQFSAYKIRSYSSSAAVDANRPENGLCPV